MCIRDRQSPEDSELGLALPTALERIVAVQETFLLRKPVGGKVVASLSFANVLRLCSEWRLEHTGTWADGRTISCLLKTDFTSSMCTDIWRARCTGRGEVPVGRGALEETFDLAYTAQNFRALCLGEWLSHLCPLCCLGHVCRTQISKGANPWGHQ
eukprot:2135165-Amphidinium_carterae.1